MTGVINDGAASLMRLYQVCLRIFLNSLSSKNNFRDGYRQLVVDYFLNVITLDTVLGKTEQLQQNTKIDSDDSLQKERLDASTFLDKW